MEYIGLLFEILFLGMGVYLYLFSLGKMQPADPKARERSEAFRRRNRWIRPLSLALIALMLVNIVLHLRDLAQP